MATADLTSTLTVSPANTMEGEVTIQGLVTNTMDSEYQVMPDLSSNIDVFQVDDLDASVSIVNGPNDLNGSISVVGGPNDIPGSLQTRAVSQLDGSLGVGLTAFMEGEAQILGPISNKVTAQYQVMPDLFSSLTVNPRSELPATIEIQPPPIETKQLKATHDAMIRETRPTLNYGDLATMVVGYDRDDNSRYRSLVKFDLTELPPNIRKLDRAVLRIYAPGSHEHANDIEVYELLGAWDESGTTWKNTPAVSETALDVATAEPGHSYIELDVYPLVHEWLFGEKEINGFLLRARSEAFDQLVTFYTSEYGQTNAPTLELTYWLEREVDYDDLSSSLAVRTEGFQDFHAAIDVRSQNIAELFPASLSVSRQDLLGMATIPEHDELDSQLAVANSLVDEIAGNINVNRRDTPAHLDVPWRDDLNGTAAVRAAEEDELISSAVISKPDMPGILAVSHHDELTANLDVQEAASQALEATLTVRQSTDGDLDSSISVINGLNDLLGQIRVLSGFLGSRLFVSYTEDFPATLKVPSHPGSKYLWISIAVRTEGYGDLEATISVVNGPNDLPASLQVASGNLTGELGVKVFDELAAVLSVSDYNDLNATLSVRQYGKADFTGTLSTFGGPNDLPATVRVISDWMRASILVVHPGLDNLEMQVTARQRDVSELSSTIVVGLPKSEIPASIAVMAYEELPATLSVEQYNTHHVDGHIGVRQKEPGDLEASLVVTETEDLPAAISVGEPTAADLAASLYVTRPELLPSWLIVHKGWDLPGSLTVAEHGSIVATIDVKRHRRLPGYLSVRRSLRNEITASLTVSRPETDGSVVITRPSQPAAVTVRQTTAGDLEATLQVSQANMGSTVSVIRRSLPGSITVEGACYVSDLRGTMTVESWQGFVSELYDLLPPVLKKDPKVVDNG